MSSFADIDVEGFEELRQKLLLLANDKDKRRESLVILRQVARPTLAVSKMLVPVSQKAHYARRQKINPGNLKESLGLITGKSKDNPTIYVGPRAKGRFKGWYGHFVHDGHKVYNNPGQGRNKLKRYRQRRRPEVVSKQVQGNPFLTRAYEQTRGRVTSDAEVKFARFLQRRIDKLSR